MAVWTQVSLVEANDWLKSRGLNTAVSINPVEEGVEDSVFKLTLADGTFACLRLFERTEPTGPLTITTILAQSGLPTCPPIEDIHGQTLVPLNGKSATLFPWINGVSEAQPSLGQIYAIGAFMGQMGKVGVELNQNWHRRNPRGWQWFTESTRQLLPVFSANQAHELQFELNTQLEFWSQNKASVPCGPIHGDLFRNNVLFDENGKLAAVLDWGFCASDEPLIYDLAIVANDWCLDGTSKKFDPARFDALMRGRESFLPMTEAEKSVWPMAIRLAALRFYLSRSIDQNYLRDPNGKTLDPGYFQKILRSHISLNETESVRPDSKLHSQLLPRAKL